VLLGLTALAYWRLPEVRAIRHPRGPHEVLPDEPDAA
jgi:hypothetical protein